MKYLKYQDERVSLTEEEAKEITDFLTSKNRGTHFKLHGLPYKSSIAEIVEGDNQNDLQGEKEQKRQKDYIKWQAEQKRNKEQTPEQKAERETRCMVPILWAARGNRLPVEREILRKCYILLLKEFKKPENLKIAWAGNEVYKNLIPYSVEKSQGKFKSVGEIIASKSLEEIERKTNVK